MSMTEELLVKPAHIAIMMDGNGRWATKRGLPRTAGHYAGMTTMRAIIRAGCDMNVRCLTLYAFSTENWTRPADEVSYLIRLPQLFFQSAMLDELLSRNVRIRYLGDIARFPADVQELLRHTAEATMDNTGMILNFALNYGGRADIMQAVRSCLMDAGSDEDAELNEERFERYLFTNDCGAPDLVIRTSGEQRLSNFLLWQAAHAELWFTRTLWPDFDKALLQEAIRDYGHRKHRLGELSREPDHR